MPGISTFLFPYSSGSDSIPLFRYLNISSNTMRSLTCVFSENMVLLLTHFAHGCIPFGSVDHAHCEELSKGGFRWKARFVRVQSAKIRPRHQPSVLSKGKIGRRGICLISPDISMPNVVDLAALEACDDEYGGIVIDTFSLPSSANAFSSALRASLSGWKFKGKKGVWLKILEEQAELVPIAIQEGFNYHHAEPGYVMLTQWIPGGPCHLPAGPSHQIGIGGFVINDRKEVLVVKEKYSCSCSGVWKLPTGYINKSEDLFSGAIREVKEETGVDTAFIQMVAFRHVHLVAFEKSDLLFVCMLEPLSTEIAIDEDEILDAKWMEFDEVISQPYYEEDHMSRKVMEICMAAHEGRHNGGFAAHQLDSKLDGKLSYLYYHQDS